MNITTIGIDVSKAKLDIFFLSSGEAMEISNNTRGFKELLQRIKSEYSVKRVIIEHTGNYQKEVVMFLQKHGFCVCVVNPNKVRNFARAMGVAAKTDKLDAKVLAQYGDVIQPEETKVQDKNISTLKELVNFRAQIIETIKQYNNRQEKHPISMIGKEIKKMITILQKQQKIIETKIREFIKSHDDILSKYQTLEKVKGFGEQTVSVLLAQLPELGCLEKRKLTALCGLAPINRDSGTMKGKRTIYGGRKIVRNALYMATVNAIRCNNVIKVYYQGLKLRGKPSKVALVACMRKLLIYANSLLNIA